MIELNLQTCADAMDAKLMGKDISFSSVSIDTRTLKEGDLFIALIGQRFDAHEKIDQSVIDKAAGLVVQRQCAQNASQLIVEDTLLALGNIARQWRQKITVPLIAITGSNGKTTVKEMLASILRQCGNVFATQGNLNNEVGMPLSLLSVTDQHDYVVLELGANHAGEIAYLNKIAQPAVALINNAGPSHLEGFGSLQGVANAKGEIYSTLSPEGTAVVNCDDAFYAQWRETIDTRSCIGFGFDVKADVRGESNEQDDFIIHHAGQSVLVQLPLPGQHNRMNALAAAAAAIAIGISLDDIVKGLEAIEAVKGRLNKKQNALGVVVFDDSYNANPASLQAGLAVLVESAAERRWCVLGDMNELGGNAAKLHQEMGGKAQAMGVDNLLAVGQFAADTVRGFGEKAQAFESVDTLVAALNAQLQKGDCVLVKGSRSARMERVVAALIDDKNNNKEERC